MLLNDIRGFKQSPQRNAGRTGFHLLTSLIFIGVFAVASASAVTVYSDAWADTTDPTAVRIVGCGLTEANYGDDWELHSVRSTTTLRSPSGRSFTQTKAVYYTWNQGSTFTVRAEPTLLFQEETGDYIISTRHYSTCPATELGTTSLLLPISLKKSAYVLIDDSNTGGEFGAGTCGYGRTGIGVCAEGAFVVPKRYPGLCPGRYIQCLTLYAGGVCYHDTRMCLEQNVPGTCDP